MTTADRRYPPIESIVLSRGWRGMDRLARHLPPDYVARAAAAQWDHRARVLITTGFYVAGHPETDGPPGAFFLGRALAHCGAMVAFVADAEPLRLLELLAGDGGWWRDRSRRYDVAGAPPVQTAELKPPTADLVHPPDFIEFPIAGAAERWRTTSRPWASSRTSSTISIPTRSTGTSQTARR
jgi:hypothetical protein